MLQKYEFTNVSSQDELGIPRLFFSAFLHNSNPLDVLNVLSRGGGYGVEVVFCRFPWNREDSEPSFEGVKFEYFELEEVVGFSTFSALSVAACEYLLSLKIHDETKLKELKGIFLNFGEVVEICMREQQKNSI